MGDLAEPQVSGYAVGRLLGRGSSAVVWLATEQRTGRDFALKCFRAPAGQARSGEAMTEQAVRREIHILSVLEHEHLIRSHDAVRLAGGPQGGTGLLMDYAPGGSLAALVSARGRLSVGETVTVLTPLAQALGYLHSKGFTHSDVSPGNVLFTGQGKPMLSDVGVARMVGDPADRAGYGTPGFVDPLPVDAVRAGLQPGRDVYSAAAVGWFCLTGSAPQRTADRPPLSLLVPEVPKELAAALEAGLNEDRRLRPTALALATEVYRSAPPLPVDLASAVHPTVIPELLTRRNAGVQTNANRVKRHVQGMHRRLATSAWRGQDSGHRMPFPQARSGVRAGGKHAARPVTPARGHRTMPVPALFAAALLAAGMAGWLIWAGAVPGVFPPASGNSSAESISSAGGSPAADGGEGQDPLSAAREQASSDDPSAALQGLAALRDIAFNSGRLELLAEVNAHGSPAAAADEQTAVRLRSSGHVLSGFASTLSGLHLADSPTGNSAVVQATSATAAYEEKDAQGGVVATGPASAGRELRLVLVAVEGRWQISAILPGS